MGAGHHHADYLVSERSEKALQMFFVFRVEDGEARYWAPACAVKARGNAPHASPPVAQFRMITLFIFNDSVRGICDDGVKDVFRDQTEPFEDISMDYRNGRGELLSVCTSQLTNQGRSFILLTFQL